MISAKSFKPGKLSQHPSLNVPGLKGFTNSANLHSPRQGAKHRTAQGKAKPVNSALFDKTNGLQIQSSKYLFYFHMDNFHLLIILTSLETPGLENMSSDNLHSIKGSREALDRGNRLWGMNNRSHRSQNQVHQNNYPCPANTTHTWTCKG